MICHPRASESHFHKKGCALRKWPIIISVLRRLASWYSHIKADTVWLLINPFCLIISARFYSLLLLLNSYPNQIIHTPPPPFQKSSALTVTTLSPLFYYCALEHHLTDRLPTFRLLDLSKNYSSFCYWKLGKDCPDTSVLILRKGREKVRQIYTVCLSIYGIIKSKTVCLILFLSSQVYKFAPATHCRQTWWTGTLAHFWNGMVRRFKSPYWLDKTKTWSDLFHDAVHIVHDGIANTL